MRRSQRILDSRDFFIIFFLKFCCRRFFIEVFNVRIRINVSRDFNGSQHSWAGIRSSSGNLSCTLLRLVYDSDCNNL
jgi:hypothetical protein